MNRRSNKLIITIFFDKEKIEILYKSFQKTLSKQMNRDNQENLYCAHYDDYRKYCDICDKFSIGRYHNNHLKSQTHNNNIRKRQHSIKIPFTN